MFAVAHSRPPWASIIERQIESPIPMPLDLVVKEGVEQAVRILGGDTGRRKSVTLTSTCCVSSWRDRITSSRGRSHDRLHCFNAIHRQVDNHLLQLDPIARDHG